MGAMSDVATLRALPKGTRLLFGGDRLIEVPDEIAERFEPGDAVVVDDVNLEVLRIPKAERERCSRAIGEARAAFAELCRVEDAAISRFFGLFADALEDAAVWSRIEAANAADVANAERRG